MKRSTLQSYAMGFLFLITSMASQAATDVSDNVIRIGLITDLSGLYADYDGQGGAEAIRMAIADMGGAIDGKKIELLVADHQNKADIASSKAREWFDTQQLDMLVGGTNSAAALAMARIAAERKKPYFVVGSGASALTNEQCTDYTVHYAYDTVALARGTAGAIVAAGGKSWYFVTADYAFGNSLQTDASTIVKANGGVIAGSVKHPLGASDFSSFLLQAQASKAQVLAFANAGGDTVNAIRAAAEFGLNKSMKVAALIMLINDVHAMGLKTAQNLYVTDSWYWNQSPDARAWGRRFFEKMKRMPSSFQAADYSATTQYLRAVKSAGSDHGGRVMKQLRSMKFDDMYVKGGFLRADGLLVHDMHLLQVKAPAESVEPWDYYRLIQTVKGEASWTTKAESRCPTWK